MKSNELKKLLIAKIKNLIFVEEAKSYDQLLVNKDIYTRGKIEASCFTLYNKDMEHNNVYEIRYKANETSITYNLLNDDAKEVFEILERYNLTNTNWDKSIKEEAVNYLKEIRSQSDGKNQDKTKD